MPVDRIVRRFAPAVLVGLVLLLGFLFIFVIPDHLVHRDLVPNGTDRTKARHDARTTLLQSLIGVLVLVGAYLTWQQVRISREGQITERFTRAIDQLGSEKLDVRLGGIHALVRIGRDSPNDMVAVLAILTAFVRGHSPWPPSLPGQYIADATWEKLPELQRRAPDVYATFRAIARLSIWDYRAESFGESMESRPDLWSCDLRASYIAEPNLRGAILGYAHLDHSIIHHGNFTYTYLNNASFRGASLNGCDFSYADMTGVDLEKSDLSDAQLEHATLESAKLQGAKANTKTTWPRNFDPKAAGVKISET